MIEIVKECDSLWGTILDKKFTEYNNQILDYL